MIPQYITIKGDDTLIRDTFSMGILNTNESALSEAKRRQQEALVRLAEERRKDKELNTLRTQVAELNEKFDKLLEKLEKK